MYHGINAYSKTAGIYNLLHRVETVGAVEACWADLPIGDLGVFCDIERADVAFITDRDAWSDVDFRGKRITRMSAIYGDNIVYSDNSFETFCRMRAEKTGRYIEICATADPDAVWVKKTASETVKMAARVIARKFKLPLMEV